MTGTVREADLDEAVIKLDLDRLINAQINGLLSATIDALAEQMGEDREQVAIRVLRSLAASCTERVKMEEMVLKGRRKAEAAKKPKAKR